MAIKTNNSKLWIEKKGTALVGAGSVNRSYWVFEWENPINVRMEKYQTKMKKKMS